MSSLHRMNQNKIRWNITIDRNQPGSSGKILTKEHCNHRQKLASNIERKRRVQNLRVLGCLYSALRKTRVFIFFFFFFVSIQPNLSFREYLYCFYLPLFNSVSKKNKLFLGRKNTGGALSPPPPPTHRTTKLRQ